MPPRSKRAKQLARNRAVALLKRKLGDKYHPTIHEAPDYVETKRPKLEYDDAIDNCVNSIQFPDFLESKAFHLRAKIRQLFCEVVQHENELETGEWFVIRDKQQIHVVNEVKTEPDIADAVKVYLKNFRFSIKKNIPFDYMSYYFFF